MNVRGQETVINRVIELDRKGRKRERKRHNENNNSSLNIGNYKWPSRSSAIRSTDTADNIIMSVKHIKSQFAVKWDLEYMMRGE